MSQNLIIANAIYSDVPAVEISKVGGGTALFVDTSGDSVTAAHLEQGYTAHDAAGNEVLGELVPGGGTLGTKSITENGTYNASDDELDGYSQVNVHVLPNLTTLTVTENKKSYSTPTGYQGFRYVTADIVNPMFTESERIDTAECTFANPDPTLYKAANKSSIRYLIVSLSPVADKICVASRRGTKSPAHKLIYIDADGQFVTKTAAHTITITDENITIQPDPTGTIAFSGTYSLILWKATK